MKTAVLLFFALILLSGCSLFRIQNDVRWHPFIPLHEQPKAYQLAFLRDSVDVDTLNVWIYFRDKGSQERLKSYKPKQIVSERSLERRHRNFPENQVLDYTDFPVNEAYVSQISANVLKVRHRSKWFNGVTVQATKKQLETLSRFPFVKNIDNYIQEVILVRACLLACLMRVFQCSITRSSIL